MASISSTKGKRGRKAKDHVCTFTGETINGLYRKPGTNIWRVRATGKEFTESDERLAIARFKAMQPKPPVAKLPVQPRIEDLHRLASDPAIQARVTQEGETDGFPLIQFSHHRHVPESEIWAWVREQIIGRPQYASTMTGIEQLAYLQDIRRPEDSPKLSTVGEVYFSKPGITEKEIGKARLWWKEFARATGANTLKEITHEALARYEKTVSNKNLSPKTIHHRYAKVKTIIHYALKRGQNPKDCRAALDTLAMLEVKQKNPIDPQPISREQFWRVHSAALKAGDQTFTAMLLLSLNAAMYQGEVSAVEWEEINFETGTLTTRRPKTGVSRIAVLWPETLEALKGLPRHRDKIFFSHRRSHNATTIGKAWRRYREAAGLSDALKFSSIRDASYSIACEAASWEQAEMLAGHKLKGTSDYYLRRRPSMVKDACRAIHRAFIEPDE